jgi:hypothetical protein
MIVYRYSNDGFTPKNQSHWRKIIKEHKKIPKPTGNKYLDELTLTVFKKNIRLLQSINMKDWHFGFWVFLQKPDDDCVQLYLNHLSKVPECHVLDIPDETVAYEIDGFVPIKNNVSSIRNIEAYIPQRQVD